MQPPRQSALRPKAKGARGAGGPRPVRSPRKGTQRQEETVLLSVSPLSRQRAPVSGGFRVAVSRERVARTSVQGNVTEWPPECTAGRVGSRRSATPGHALCGHRS